MALSIITNILLTNSQTARQPDSHFKFKHLPKIRQESYVSLRLDDQV